MLTPHSLQSSVRSALLHQLWPTVTKALSFSAPSFKGHSGCQHLAVDQKERKNRKPAPYLPLHRCTNKDFLLRGPVAIDSYPLNMNTGWKITG